MGETTKKVIEKLIEGTYQNGIEAGRNEALEAIKKIYLSVNYGGLSDDELYDTFGEGCLFDIFNKFSASEVIARIKVYEEKKQEEDEKSKEFKVGDVIKMNGHSAVITWCDGDHWNGICVQGVDNSEVGMTYHGMKYDGWTKTGETIPGIVKLLRK